MHSLVGVESQLSQLTATGGGLVAEVVDAIYRQITGVFILSFVVYLIIVIYSLHIVFFTYFLANQSRPSIFRHVIRKELKINLDIS